jgi:hypothetical protein
MKTSATIGSAVLALAFAGAAFAQAPAPSAPSANSQFGSIDANKDGRVSQSEADSHSELKTAFATLDTDRDSHLSQTEFAKFKGKAAGAGSTDPMKAPPAGNVPQSDTGAAPAPQSAPAAE